MPHPGKPFPRRGSAGEEAKEFGAILHKKLILIHPFADGNGRMTRLTMNAVLIQKGFLPTIIPPVLRSEYIDSLRTVDKDDAEFFAFIYRCEIETQKEMLRLLEGAEHKKSEL